MAIISQHAAFVELFAAILDGSPDLVFVGSAANARDGAQVVRRARPEITLLDEDVTDGSRLDSIKILVARPSGHTHARAQRGVAAGGRGHRGARGRRRWVRSQARLGARGAPRDPGGAGWRDRRRARDVRVDREGHAGRQRTTRPASGALTPRELEVLTLMARGHDPQAIAIELGIRISTCRGYEKSIMAKLDVHSQLEAVVAATERGLVRLPTG